LVFAIIVELVVDFSDQKQDLNLVQDRGFRPAADVLFWLASKKEAKNGLFCPSGCPKLTFNEFVSSLRNIGGLSAF